MSHTAKDDAERLDSHVRELVGSEFKLADLERLIAKGRHERSVAMGEIFAAALGAVRRLVTGRVDTARGESLPRVESPSTG